MSVRKATYEDIPWVLEELKDFADFFDSKNYIYGGDEYISNLCRDLIDNHVFYVYDDQISGLIGFISGQISKHLYNKDISVLYELWWWVKPEHRKNGAGLELMEAFTKWGEENVNWTIFNFQMNTPINEKILLDRGYKPLEKVYILEKEF